MRLFIFRHGETEGNVKNICQGISDKYGLTEKGKEQAENLKQILAKENFEVIFASPLKRTRETAAIIASGSGAEIIVIDELKEIDFGDAEGMPGCEMTSIYKDFFEKAYDPEHKEFWSAKIPNGENKHEIISRFLRAVEYIKENYKHLDKVGVASHGGIMRVIHYYFSKENRGFGNCEYFVLEV